MLSDSLGIFDVATIYKSALLSLISVCGSNLGFPKADLTSDHMGRTLQSCDLPRAESVQCRPSSRLANHVGAGKLYRFTRAFSLSFRSGYKSVNCDKLHRQVRQALGTDWVVRVRDLCANSNLPH